MTAAAGKRKKKKPKIQAQAAPVLPSAIVCRDCDAAEFFGEKEAAAMQGWTSFKDDVMGYEDVGHWWTMVGTCPDCRK